MTTQRHIGWYVFNRELLKYKCVSLVVGWFHKILDDGNRLIACEIVCVRYICNVLLQIATVCLVIRKLKRVFFFQLNGKLLENAHQCCGLQVSSSTTQYCVFPNRKHCDTVYLKVFVYQFDIKSTVWHTKTHWHTRTKTHWHTHTKTHWHTQIFR